MASKTSHFGEFCDDVTYSHKRIATVLGRNEKWVLDNLFFPVGEPGVAYRKLGTLYLTTGEAIRIWIERGMEPSVSGEK